jgi:hypothetical protein
MQTAPEDDLASALLAETQITFAELNLRTQTDYQSSFSTNSGSNSFGIDCAFLVSTSLAGNTLLHHNGCPGTDRRATAGFRIDEKLAPHQLHSFTHADQPQAATFEDFFLVKANSQVIHGQFYVSRRSMQLHPELSFTAVLNCILQRFL